ncbi:12091_t:CDS:2, partial [Acaulospora colombiana]
DFDQDSVLDNIINIAVMHGWRKLANQELNKKECRLLNTLKVLDPIIYSRDEDLTPSDWDIIRFLNECNLEPYTKKIDCYLKSLLVISNTEDGQRRLKAQELLDLYKQESIFTKISGVMEGTRPDKRRARKWENERSNKQVHIHQPISGDINSINGTVINGGALHGGVLHDQKRTKELRERKKRVYCDENSNPDTITESSDIKTNSSDYSRPKKVKKQSQPLESNNDNPLIAQKHDSDSDEELADTLEQDTLGYDGLALLFNDSNEDSIMEKIDENTHEEENKLPLASDDKDPSKLIREDVLNAFRKYQNKIPKTRKVFTPAYWGVLDLTRESLSGCKEITENDLQQLSQDFANHVKWKCEPAPTSIQNYFHNHCEKLDNSDENKYFDTNIQFL